MKFINVVLFSVTLMVACGLKAQNIKVQSENTGTKHAVGIAAGFSTGYGLSYRFVPKKFGFQLAFAPYTSELNSLYSFGGTLLYKVIEKEKSSLFIYQGNHLLYTKFPGDKTKYYEYVNGIGIGIEFIFAKNISFNLMGGFANYSESYSHANVVSLTAETGLFYKF